MPDTLYVTSNCEFLVDPSVYDPNNGILALSGDVDDQVSVRGRIRYRRPAAAPETFLATTQLYPIPIMCQPVSWANYVWYEARYKTLREAFDTEPNLLDAYRRCTKDYTTMVERLGLAPEPDVQKVRDAVRQLGIEADSDDLLVSPFKVDEVDQMPQRVMSVITPALLP